MLVPTLNKKLISTSLFLLGLTACGGGSTPSTSVTPPPTTPINNNAPEISDIPEQTIFEHEEFSFTASATDSDGTINNMSWVHKSGVDVPNANIDGNTISFKVPNVTEEQTVVFTFLATDDDAAESQKDLTINIKAYKNIADINMPDVALKSCIEEMASVVGEVADVGMFGADSWILCENKGIKDITGLEEFKNVEQVYLSSNKITDLTPLADLEKIEVLNIQFNKIASLNGISKLTKLRELVLHDNLLTSLNGLPNALEINYLSARNNQLTTLNGIDAISNITQVDVMNNQLVDISALASLDKLTVVNVAQNNLSSLNGLESHSALTTLAIGFNPFTDISALPASEHIKSLQLATFNQETQRRDLPLSDLSPLGRLTGLESLWIEGDNITDISPISSLNNLKELKLVTYQVSDISALSNLTQLEKLTLSSYTTPSIGLFPDSYELEGKVTDLSPLSNLTSLKELGIDKMAAADFSPISDLSNLEFLSIQNNRNYLFSPFKELTNLKYFYFFVRFGQAEDDINVLSKLTKLQEFTAYWSDTTTSLALLDNMPELKRLTILGSLNNPISDFSPLTKHKDQLTHLTISSTHLNDTSFLTEFNTLKILQLNSNKTLFNLTPLQQLTQLEQLNLWYNDHINCGQFDDLENALPSTLVERPNSCAAN